MHMDKTGPGEPTEDGEKNEMTLPSKHRIRISIPGGQRPSTLILEQEGSPLYWNTKACVDLTLDQRLRRRPNIRPTQAFVFSVMSQLQACIVLRGRFLWLGCPCELRIKHVPNQSLITLFNLVSGLI